MKYVEQPRVAPAVREQSKREIDAVNAYMDGLKGVVISFEFIRGGQTRPYGDTIDEYLIFAHQPNSYTTNAPSARSFTRDEIAAIAKVVIGGWSDNPQFLERRLECLGPMPNPCGIREYSEPGDERHCCWRLILRTPWND